MKAISLSRPWGYAILHLGKRIENRRIKTGRVPHICKHRGPLLLHNAQSWDDSALEYMFSRGLVTLANNIARQKDNPIDDSLRPGGIFALANGIGRMHRNHDGSLWPAEINRAVIIMGPEARVTRAEVRTEDRHIKVTGPDEDASTLGAAALGLDLRWWMGGDALVFDDAVLPTTFHPCRGKLGLWNVDPDISASYELE